MMGGLGLRKLVAGAEAINSNRKGPESYRNRRMGCKMLRKAEKPLDHKDLGQAQEAGSRN